MSGYETAGPVASASCAGATAVPAGKSPTAPGSLSIVIPSHSRPDLLKLCLTSVSSFAPPNTEIIVVDDGSRDAIVSRAAEPFAGVKVVRRARAGGFCVAANAGIAAATGAVIELLNDDAEVTAGWTDAALHWFADPRVGAVAPLVLQNDPDRLARGLSPLIDTAGDEYDFGGFARKRGHGSVWTSEGHEPSECSVQEIPHKYLTHSAPSECPAREIPHERSGHDVPLEPSAQEMRSGSLREATRIRGAHAPRSPGVVWGASACAAFYRADALRAAGGFPEHFGAYFEDVDLSFRLRRLGCEIVFDPGAVVWHRVSGSYGRTPSRRTLERQSCNEERVFWRNVRGRERVKYLPRHAAVLAGKALRRWQEGALLPWLLGRVRAAVT